MRQNYYKSAGTNCAAEEKIFPHSDQTFAFVGRGGANGPTDRHDYLTRPCKSWENTCSG